MREEQNERIKCLIIGSGPSGYTAAIYMARSDLKPVLYTGLFIGGQLTKTSDVENYPGYPDGVMGPQMMENFHKQASRMGADLRIGYVSAVDFSQSPYKITIGIAYNMKNLINSETTLQTILTRTVFGYCKTPTWRKIFWQRII